MVMAANSDFYLNDRHFAWACAAALALHVAGFGAWVLAPKEKIKEIPVRVLNIKLGDGEDINVVSSPATSNTAPVEAALSRNFKEAPPPPQAKAPPPAPKTSTSKPSSPKLAKAITQEAQQFVRKQTFDYKGLQTTTKPTATAQAPSSLGNSAAADAESIRRYEQLVSSWYWKFHFYPETARQQRLESKGVVRVEYDRAGNLRSYSVERSTGSQVLDRAMLDIANRANPFPPVPDNYKPGSPVVAFTIQVIFTLTDKPNKINP